MRKPKKLIVSLLVAIVLLSTLPIAALAETSTNSTPPQVKLPDEPANYEVPESGTIPLPPSKEIAFPPPDGLATIAVDFPDVVRVNEPFNIAVTFKTSEPPNWSYLMTLTQLHIPGEVSSTPTDWTQQCICPWAPARDITVSGTIEILPSREWLLENWNTWYGVGIIPHNEGHLLVACGQAWQMGHYFWARNGDTVIWTFSPFSFSEPGTYTFIVYPYSYYMDVNHLVPIYVRESISFEVEVVKCRCRCRCKHVQCGTESSRCGHR